MRSVFRGLLGMLCCLLAVLGNAQGPVPHAVATAAENSVVRIQGYDADGKMLAPFAGVAVAEDQLVVNWHLLRGVQRAEASTAKGGMLTLRDVLAEDRVADLALVRVESATKLTPLTFSSALPCEEDAIYRSNWSDDTTARTTPGAIANIRYFPLVGRVWQLTAPALQALGGSAAFTADGNALGIITIQPVKDILTPFIIPGARITAMKAGTPIPLAEWNAKIPADWTRSAEGHYVAGTIALWGNDNEGAAEHFRQATSLQPGNADAWLQYADSLLLIKALNEAQTAAQTAVSLAPKSAEAHEMLGGVLGELGLAQQAAAQEQIAIQLDPNLARAHCHLGWIYASTQRPQEAIAEELAALKLRMDYVKALVNLGMAYQQLQQWDKVVATYTEILRIRPGDVASACDLGIAYAKLGMWKETGETFFHAAQRNPERAETYMTFAQTLPPSGEESKAACLALIQLAMKTENCAKVINNFAWALGNAKIHQWLEAGGLFKAQTKLDPQDYNGFFGLGWAYTNQGREADAIQPYEEGVRLYPQGINIRIALGGAYRSAERYTDAETVLKEAVKMASDNADAHYSLAVVETYLQNRSAVQAEYEFLQKRNDQRTAYLKKWLDENP